MASILKAEEKLAQNDQNVEIFEVLRNTMTSKKPIKGKGFVRTDSRLSQPDPEENNEDLPDLNKSKTYGHNREKREIFEEQSIPEPEKMEEEIQQQIKQEKIENQSAKVEEKVEAPPLVEKKSKQIVVLPLKRGRKSKKQKIFEQEEEEESLPKNKIVNQSRDKDSHIAEQMQIEQPEQEAESQQSEDSPEDEKSADDNQYDRRNKAVAAKRKPAEVRVGTVPRKRGRPKKQQIIEEIAEQSPPQAPTPKNTNRLQKIKRKIQKNRPSPKKVQIVPQNLSDSDLAILQTVKQLAMNRDRLIDYLCSIEITITNVKQILDLDVSNILHDGEISQKVIDLLELFKAAILYKYFPEDVKHRKKYEKLSKKRTNDNRNRDKGDEMVDEKDENEREAPKEKDQEKEENTPSRFDENEIRKKTIIKIEKFLRAGSDLEHGAKAKAIEIEGYFERADPCVGERYRNIAKKVLINLKERTESWEEVLQNLERNAYD